jgi:polyisoprenoid-binding protein YceI
MKLAITSLIVLFSASSWAQMAVVDVTLRPAGSFKVKTSDVKGFAQKKADHVEANNIVVNLKNVQTGITVRDGHTKKHLDVDKFPDAVLVSAKGSGGKGEGVLRIKGIEHKIEGTYEIEGSNLTAHFPINLSDYKIDGIKYMGVGVSDSVTLNVTVPLKNN